MKLRLLWVGRTREQWVQQGVDMYLKRLGNFAEVEVVEIKEQRGVSTDSARTEALRLEGDRILKQTSSEFMYFDQGGSQMDSVRFAGLLENRTRAEFLIGGPYGVAPEVAARAGSRIALSKMTFTHEMARLIALEQLYRAMTILSGRSYHH